MSVDFGERLLTLFSHILISKMSKCAKKVYKNAKCIEYLYILLYSMRNKNFDVIKRES